MGADAPIPPVTMNAAAPKGAPRQINDRKPPCSGEALKQGMLLF